MDGRARRASPSTVCATRWCSSTTAARDGSWEVISEKARTHDDVIAVDLLKNYGQHHANLAGLRETTGDFVITMDDDGQNPAGPGARC